MGFLVSPPPPPPSVWPRYSPSPLLPSTPTQAQQYTAELHRHHQVEAIFGIWDNDHSGYIECEELKLVLGRWKGTSVEQAQEEGTRKVWRGGVKGRCVDVMEGRCRGVWENGGKVPCSGQCH